MLTDELTALKAQRDAITARIELIEKGVKKAAYDAEMNRQLVLVNEARVEQGKPPLTMSQFASGCFTDYHND